MICNILGCNTESYFRVLYSHYNKSKTPFAKEIMRVCENHAKMIADDDTEINAIKWGEKMVAKLAVRVKELETELEVERRRQGDANKSLRKTQRGIHEYCIKMEEIRCPKLIHIWPRS